MVYVLAISRPLIAFRMTFSHTLCWTQKPTKVIIIIVIKNSSIIDTRFIEC